MKCLSRWPALLLPCVLGACSTHTTDPATASPANNTMYTHIADRQSHQTMLLVSLEDGSVIKQSIDGYADICFKQSSSSSTTCLTEGDAIVDPATNTVIGFEMIEDHIDLIAKQD